MPPSTTSSDRATDTPTTIREVAAKAGVSLATVSRALNGSAPVRPDKAQRVHSAAQALGFRLNRMGHNLRSTRTRTVGVMLPTLAHPVFAECLQALEAAAREHGHALTFATTGYDPANEERSSEALLSHQVDGLVLTVANAGRSRVLDKLEREGVPYVLVYNEPQRGPRRRLSVAVNNRQAACHMVQHMLRLGHTRVCMVAGPFAQSDRARLRHLGYLDAMKAAGLPAAPAIELDFMAHDVRPALVDLLGRRQRPSALFCSSDQLAMRVMHALHSLGLRVPQDMGVAGFDGVQMGQWWTPTLSTVVQPTQEIARVAFDLLLASIQGRSSLARATLHHSVRSGDSVAALAAP